MRLIVLLSVITIASCTVPSVFLNPKATGKKNCFCKEKECTDVSCEEKNCLCLVKGLRALQDKECSYDKSLSNNYLQLVQERCLCIQGCQKICNPDEFVKCSSSAFDRFLCKYQDFLKTNSKKKGFKDFLADIKNTQAECINKDCKPTCSGNGDCDPFQLELDDCGQTKACVNTHIQSLAGLIKDANIKEQLKEFRISVGALYDQLANCEELTDPKTQYICKLSANNGFNSQHESFEKNLINVAGPCTATSILSSLNQGVAECSLG